MSISAPVLSLQQITDLWGQWFAKNKAPKSGGCVFTASTNYKAVKALAQAPKINEYISKYQVTLTVGMVNYGQPTKKDSPTSNTFYGTNYSNGSSNPQTTTLEVSTTTQQSANWTVTQTVSIGIDVKVEAGFPSYGSISATARTSVDLTDSAQQGTSFSRQWGASQTVLVSPKTVACLSVVVTQNRAEIPWTADVMMERCVAISFKNAVTFKNYPSVNSKIYFVPIADVFADCVSSGCASVAGYELNTGANPPNVKAHAQGIFSGSGGLSSNISLNEEPVGSSAGTQPTVTPLCCNATPG